MMKLIFAAAIAMAVAGRDVVGGNVRGSVGAGGGGISGEVDVRIGGDFRRDPQKLRDAVTALRNDASLKDDAVQAGAKAGVFADFNGNSGSFKLYMNNTVDASARRGRRFWQMQYMAVRELAADGVTLVKQALVTPQRISKDVEITVDAETNVTTRTVIINSTLPEGGSHAMLSVRHSLSDGPHNHSVPCSSCHAREPPFVTAQAGDLKMTVQVYGWTFAAGSSGLEVVLKVADGDAREGQDGAPDRVPPPPQPTEADVQASLEHMSPDMQERVMAHVRVHGAAAVRVPPVVRMPGDDHGPRAQLTFETIAVVDGDSANPVLVNVTVSGNRVSIGLPVFTSSVWYDPTVNMDDSTMDSNGAGATGGSTLAALAVAGVMVVLAEVRGRDE